MTPAQAKKRLLAFEKQVYNPACAFIHKDITDEEYEKVYAISDFHICLARVHKYLLAQTRDPQNASVDENNGPSCVEEDGV